MHSRAKFLYAFVNMYHKCEAPTAARAGNRLLPASNSSIDIQPHCLPSLALPLPLLYLLAKVIRSFTHGLGKSESYVKGDPAGW